MANLISIQWSVEEFRRLISEQPDSSEGADSIESTIDVSGPETRPTPVTIDPESPKEHADLLEAETASGALQPDKLSDLVVAEVMALTASQTTCSEKPVASLDADRVRDIALDILHSEASRTSNVLVAIAENTASLEVDIATLPQASADGRPTKSAATLGPEVQEAPARSAGTEMRNLELPHLKEVVVEPDLLTERFEYARAIELRWVLRDIRSSRIKWSPPREADLNILIELDLVTMRNGLPELTPSGMSAV